MMKNDFSLFGLISALAGLFEFGAGKAKQLEQDSFCKQVYRDEDLGIYQDGSGNWRDMKTNKIVVITKRGSDTILVDKDGCFFRNVTAEKRFAKAREAEKRFNEMFPNVNIEDFITVELTQERIEGVSGNIFKDKKTGDYLVIRTLCRGIYSKKEYSTFCINNRINFYHVLVDCRNPHIIRLSDDDMFKMFVVNNLFGNIVDLNKATKQIQDMNNWIDKYGGRADGAYNCYEYWLPDRDVFITKLELLEEFDRLITIYDKGGCDIKIITGG